MKIRTVLMALGTLLALAFISCADASGPANDPSTAVSVMGSASSMCLSPSSPTPGVTFSTADADFTGSAFAAEVAAGMFMYSRQVTFTNFQIAVEDKTYTLNGTFNTAGNYDIDYTSDSAGTTMTMNVTSYLYTTGLTLSGPDYEGSFAADCKQDMNLVMTTPLGGGKSTNAITITTTGTIAGQAYSNAVMSLSY